MTGVDGHDVVIACYPMRRPVALLAIASSAVVAALTLWSPAARATDCSGNYSPCISSDILWPHAGPARFVAIGSADTVAPGQVSFGLATTYLSRPIILHTPGPGPGGTDQYAVDNQVNGTFLWAYGVSDRLEIDLAVPLTFIQSGAGLSPLTGGDALKDTAVRDMRFGIAYAIVPHTRAAPDSRPDACGMVGRAEVSAPTGDVDQLASEGSGVFVPSVSGDCRSGKLFVGGELGGRLRPTSTLAGARVGPQLVTALGVGYDILPRELLTAALEAWVLPDFAQQAAPPLGASTPTAPNGQYIAPAEWQLSARTAPLRSGDFSVQLGGGSEIPLTNGAVTMPRFRFTLGLRWAPTGRELAKLARAAPAGGAPLPPAAAVVDLHIAGAKDVCNSDPDLVDGFKDTNGCPDEDQDKDGVPDRFDKCPMVPEDFVGLTDGCPEKH